MTDRNVEAQPGDNRKTEPQGSTEIGQTPRPSLTPVCHDCGSERTAGVPYCANCGSVFDDAFAAPQPVSMPRKADLSHSDQAIRVRPAADGATATPAATSPKASPTPAKAVAKVSPAAKPSPAARLPKAETAAEPADAAPAAHADSAAAHADSADGSVARAARPSAPHPLSKRRKSSTSSIAGAATTARAVANLIGASAKNRIAHVGGRPGRTAARGVFGVGGFVATFAIVAGLLVVLPSHPTLDTPGGSVYTIDWHATTKLPVASFDYGPYFATVDDTLLMVGTVNSTTTVWSSSDGSTWNQRSSAGAFGMDGRTFVAQGIADDGNGGLIVVGNSLGSTATDVAAAAWHSHDGSAWTQMQVDYGNGQLMGGGVATQDGTSVSAGNGVAWLSTNGSAWAPVVLPGAVGQGGAYTPSVVGTWDGGFMIVGLWIGSGATRSAAWYSSTGRDWVEATTPLNGFMAVSCAAIDGRFVAVGSDLGDSSPGLSASWSTTDGKTWTESTAPTDLAGVAIDGVTRVGNSLVSFGAPKVSSPAVVQAGPTLPGSTPQATVSELVWVTDDGVNWIPIQSKAAPLASAKVTSVGNRVVLVGESSSGLVSLGGDLALGAARPISGQLAAGDFVLSLAAGNVPMTPDVSKGYTLGPITSSADRFYVFATGPTGTSILNSTNGGLWVQELRPTGLTKIATADQAVVTGRPVVLQAISDGHGGIIAVGKITNTDGDNGMIWHMTKPGVWKQVNFQDDTPGEFTSIASGSTGFVVSTDRADGPSIMYSADGDTWHAGSITVAAGLPLIVASYHYGFIAVGSDPAKGGATTAWTSTGGRTWTIRSDWRLPANVTSIVGMGYGFVATARTAIPTTSASAGSSSLASPKTSAGASPAKATPTPKPTPTPKLPANLKPTTWWYSASGVSWAKSGLTTSDSGWGMVGGEIVALDAPSKLANNWGVYSSPDGRNWKQSSVTVSFAGSKVSEVASRNNMAVIIGWQADGVLKDFYGWFATGS